MTTQDKKEQLFEQLKQYVSDIIGADVAEELNITKDSTFTKDLEMDSIEIVSFAEKVKKQYGHRIDFTGWLSGMSIDQLINLSINDIVNFIADADNSNK